MQNSLAFRTALLAVALLLASCGPAPGGNADPADATGDVGVDGDASVDPAVDTGDASDTGGAGDDADADAAAPDTGTADADASLDADADSGSSDADAGVDTADDTDSDSGVLDADSGTSDADVMADTDPPGPAPQDVITINELACRGTEWVEIHNSGPDDVDLAGWLLSDNEGVGGMIFGTRVVPAGGWITVAAASAEPGGLPFALTCDGEEVSLFDADGSLVDSFRFGRVPAGATWGRVPDGTGAPTRTTPTRNAENSVWVDASDELFDPFAPFEVRIVLPETSRASLYELPREYVPADLRVVDAAGALLFDAPTMVRIKGRYGSARTLDAKCAFKIDLDELDATGQIRGVRKLTLNNMVQDPSFFHEWIAYTMFRDLGVPAPRIGYARVWVDDVYYGLYAHIETHDDALIDRYFPFTRHLYEGAYGDDFFPENVGLFEVDEGSETNRSDLENLANILSVTPLRSQWSELEPFLNVDAVVMAMAVESYIGHWDGYAPTRNNYYLHFDDRDVLTLIPSGTDQTFSQHLDPFSGQALLLQACLVDPTCLRQYSVAMIRVMRYVEETDLIGRARAVWTALEPHILEETRVEAPFDYTLAVRDETYRFLEERPSVSGALNCEVDPANDSDGDGFGCARDCSPDDADVYPGAVDVCGDGVDQDCNGWVDDDVVCPDCVQVDRGGHPYWFCTRPRTWEEAYANCADLGAALVNIGDQAELVWVHQTSRSIRDRSIWVSLNDIVSEGVWVDAYGAPATFAPWNAGEPNNSGGEDCAQLTASVLYNDLDCDAGLLSACEELCEPGLDRDGDGYGPCDADCDDGDANVNPDAEETCGDDIDNDCDGVADPFEVCPDCEEFAYEDRWFAACPYPRTFADAQAQCTAFGGTLPLIDDLAENERLFAIAVESMGETWVWIGLNDVDREGSFAWVDGLEREFANWAGGEPNDWGGAEDCAHFYGDSSWNDIGCDNVLATLCELPPR